MDRLSATVLEEYRKLFDKAPDFRIFSVDTLKPKPKEALYRFYDDSAKALVKLLSAGFDRIDIRDIDKAEYLLTGHSQTYSNMRGELAGILGSMLICSSDRSVDKVNRNLGARLAIAQNNDLMPVVFCSDLPRALHHAILKYDPSKEKMLAEIALKPIVKKEGLIEMGDYLKLLDLAFSIGIIPTPLLRAQYFSRGELSNGEAPDDDILMEFIENRRNLNYRIKDGTGRDASESYVTYTFLKGFQFLDMLINKQHVVVPQADLITHSGFFDVARTYFRYLDDSSRIVLERTPTKKTRGDVVRVKLGVEEGKNKKPVIVYRNDAKKLEPYIEKAERIADTLQNRSIDELIKNNKGLIETPLIQWQIDGNMDVVSTRTSIEGILKNPYPTLIFGNGGEGKTTLLTQIVRKHVEGYKRNDTPGWIPVVHNCFQISDDFNNNNIKGRDDLIRYLLKGLEGIANHFDNAYKVLLLLDDYQKIRYDYQGLVSDVIMTLAQDSYHQHQDMKIIIFTRRERRDVRPPINRGFCTVQIDSLGITDNIEEFIRYRIDDEEKQAEFIDFISPYDESITGNYMTLFGMTQLFNNPKETLKYFVGSKRERYANLLMEGRLNRAIIYDIISEYRIGREIEQQKPDVKDIAKEIKERKDHLSTFAVELGLVTGNKS